MVDVEGTRNARLASVIFFHFHAVFEKKYAKQWVSAPTVGLVSFPQGNPEKLRFVGILGHRLLHIRPSIRGGYSNYLYSSNAMFLTLKGYMFQIVQ